ncbi:DeoR/GlpR family DNA-binding transcription regulator [Agromyces atrinae]|uniref:DeoR/GlpR family DNA-binding transcription regulator n=1 Tax=Agromyces atrinae TaxID=592376 RepID=UPI001F561224|nr:DeoR/GlpR family DNA-binding transcription regulator [Agromyces atrinae]MCI2956265.1 DeoR/GlpR family DNA-binding transcription regulator [Agromyces atrinae]
MSPTEANGPRKFRHLPAGRRSDLAEYVTANGQMTVADLAERYGVSIDTIRRDLDRLDSDGVLVRTHGGAVSGATGPRPDRDLDVRLRLQTAEKEQIAELAAGLVPDGSVIMLNAGTTTLATARHLRNHRDLTIATNNLRIPAEISAKAFRDLYVFGGSVRSITQATTGPVVLRASAGGHDVDLQCDLAIIGVGAVSATSGYSTSNLGDASMMAEMMNRSQQVAVVADSSKFDRRLFAQVAELGRADYFVTNERPPAELEAALRAAEVELLYPES